MFSFRSEMVRFEGEAYDISSKIFVALMKACDTQHMRVQHQKHTFLSARSFLKNKITFSCVFLQLESVRLKVASLLWKG